MHRAARQAHPTYDTLCATVRGSPVVTVDETSWRVDAVLQWLWVVGHAGDDGLCDPARPRPGASRLGHRPRLSGRAAARRLALVSLLHGGGPSDVSRAPAAALSRAAARLSGAAVRDRGEDVLAGRARHARRLHAGHDLGAWPRRRARPATSSGSGACWSGRPVATGRIALLHQHLVTEFAAIFSFLFDPTLDATNWRAEHALRPAVITRKMCGGGNRTARGAKSQQVLASVLRTADQRRLDADRCARRAAHRSHAQRPARAPHRPRDYTDPLNTHLPTSNSNTQRGFNARLEVGSWELGIGSWELAVSAQVISNRPRSGLTPRCKQRARRRRSVAR